MRDSDESLPASGSELERETDQHIGFAVSLLGDWAYLDVIAAVCELSVESAAATLAALEHSGAVCATAPAQFSVAAAGIEDEPAVAVRANMHARAARELQRRAADGTEICGHLLAAPSEGSQASVRALRCCARRHTQAGNAKEAARLLERALDEPPSGGQRFCVLIELTDALLSAGDHEQAARLARRACKDCASVREQADAEMRLFRAEVNLGRVEAGLSRLLSAIDRIETVDPNLALGMEAQLLGGSVAEDGRIMHATLRRYERRAVDESLPNAAAYLLGVGQVQAMGGAANAEEAVAIVDRGLTLRPAALHDHEAVMRTVWLLARADQRVRAGQELERARAQMRRGAPTPALAAMEGLIEVRFGSVLAATEMLEGTLTQAQAARNPLAVWAALAFYGIALLESDRAADLKRLLTEHDPDQHEGLFAALLRVTRGRLRLQAGHNDLALRDLLGVEEEKRALGLPNPAGFHHIEPAVQALLALGDHARATELAELNLRRADAWGAPLTVALARSAIAACAALAQRAERMQWALSALSGVRGGVTEAQLLLELGRALADGGRRDDARGALGEALDRATRIQAVRICREARAVLKSIGARPRRPFTRGVRSLTGAELQVAQPAAEGLTNRAIAAGLHLSVRTVENHLRSVYAKLETDRGGLAARLGRAPVGVDAEIADDAPAGGSRA